MQQSTVIAAAFIIFIGLVTNSCVMSQSERYTRRDAQDGTDKLVDAINDLKRSIDQRTRTRSVRAGFDNPALSTP